MLPSACDFLVSDDKFPIPVDLNHIIKNKQLTLCARCISQWPGRGFWPTQTFDWLFRYYSGQSIDLSHSDVKSGFKMLRELGLDWL